MLRMKSLTAAIAVVGCLGAVVAQAAAPTRLEVGRTLSGGVRDAAGVRPNAATDPSTPLYTAVGANPILAPDGHHLTWGEWSLPFDLDASYVNVKCINKGTHAVFHLEGLIPNALYSLWLFVQKTATSPLDAGRLPQLNSVANSFVAAADGTATISFISPPGPLSIDGDIGSCLLAYENFSYNLAYHSDGQLYGDVPGPDEVTVQQFNFQF